jgi:hypothetical protein
MKKAEREYNFTTAFNQKAKYLIHGIEEPRSTATTTAYNTNGAAATANLWGKGNF